MKKLSCREIEVMNYIAKGNTAKEIARLVSLEPRTIEAYMTNARKKLQAKNIAHAVYLAYQSNILTSPVAG
ncbi:MAG: hypothetical protein A3E85_00640 [Gammaproteobacteria bacterium RIFCSPHIGHO2_12_FULL_45_12]|nr:MAG: hypothetical protein A3E85_00640 [Gammaproteobacteria bacterium RIFCSPHIGHO2_12_FULL_45_12]